MTAAVSVSQLNRLIKNYLEQEIGRVCVEGELSNVTKPGSGHFYFTLKDTSAQIRCVFFKNRHVAPLCHQLKDGLKVIASGKLSLYEARGDYQLIVEDLQEAGLGALYLQFEALKNKLAQEGLFAAERKKPLPKIPKHIGIISSSNGAALHDMLSTLARRFPLANVFIFPSEVQGATAHEQLIKALRHANQMAHCDVLLLARGGGSIEDLWAFNNELLAREIAASTIPIVSGVGHETDFTIADFVADYRAETPTAAATISTPHQDDLKQYIDTLEARIHRAMTKKLQEQQTHLGYLTSKINSPSSIVASHWQTIDYLEKQLILNLKRIIQDKKQRSMFCTNQLHHNNPLHYLQHSHARINQLAQQLAQQMRIKINTAQYALKSNLTTLHAVSPLATLDRGYSITSYHGKIIDNASLLKIDDSIHVRLAQGSIECNVTHIND